MKLQPTEQQQAIIEAIREGKSVAVKALAGAAKTSTCIMVAEAVPCNILYIAYNKSIADEAKTKFPAYVECRTAHSLAYGSIINRFKLRKKLQGFFDRASLKDLATNDSLVQPVVSLITSFCNSAEPDLATLGKKLEVDDAVILLAVEFWNRMVDSKSDVMITHDVYLKLYGLFPDINKELSQYDLIIVDEAQDLNPVILDIVCNQDSQKVFVGDEYQQIYGFREAINAFDSLKGYTELSLTTSYRFGQAIANKARKIISAVGYTGEFTGGRVDGAKSNDEVAILARTNADLLDAAYELALKGKKIKIIGGFKEVYSDLYSLLALAGGNKDKVYSNLIKQFNSFAEAVEAKESQPEVAKLLQILSRHQQIHKVITEIKAATVTRGEYDVVLSTAHKSKGLEFRKVILLDGFLPYKDREGREFESLARSDQLACLVDTQILNLIYIALTRAEQEVVLPQELKDFFGV